MAYDSGWNNARVMAIQGKAPGVTKIMNEIMNDPFSQCFFLSTLYASKEEKLKIRHPEYFVGANREVVRKRVEVILIEMYEHILDVKINGLHSLKNTQPSQS
jgi:hypothetical protein